MKGFTPSKWLWGLVAVLFFAFLSFAGEGSRIERNFTLQASAALKAQGLDWATMPVLELKEILTGTVFDAREHGAARMAAGPVRSAAAKQDQAKLLPDASPYTWWASRDAKTIRIKGHVPSVADQRTIVGIVKATLPGLEIDDRTKLASGVPVRENWLAAVSFALNQLSHFEKGGVWLWDMQLRVAGLAINQASYAALLKALDEPQPAGLTLQGKDIAPPKASPYSIAMEYSRHRVKLSGYVPNDEVRKTLIDKIGAELAGVVVEDTMMPSSGMPKAWSDAVMVAIGLLSRLEEGAVTIRNKDLKIEGSVADQAKADEISKLIRETLPKSYTPSEKIRVKKTPAPPDRRGAADKSGEGNKISRVEFAEIR